MNTLFEQRLQSTTRKSRMAASALAGDRDLCFHENSQAKGIKYKCNQTFQGLVCPEYS
jgi:hypothetical protein